MLFTTSCYGHAYAPFLAVCLRSLRQSHPDTPVLVTYDGLPRRIVRALDAANPNTTFREIAGLDDFIVRDEAEIFADGEPVTIIDATDAGGVHDNEVHTWATLLHAEEMEIGMKLMPWRQRVKTAAKQLMPMPLR